MSAIDPDSVDIDDPWSIGELRRSGIDIVHVHFGFEHLSPAALDDWCHDLQDARIALVHTVHDLDNPHLADQCDHRSRTALLVERSDEVVTLTPRAAERIADAFGREAVVIPHPPLIEEIRTARIHRVARATRSTDGCDRRVMVWLGTCRPNLDVAAVSDLVADRTIRTRVVVRRDGWEACDDGFRSVLLAARDDGSIELDVIERPDDDAFALLIARAAVVVLPYAWGTHSGIVELATDLGVPSVTTDVGCHADQGATAVPSTRLAAAVAGVLHSSGPIRRPTRSSLERIRRLHRELYLRVG